MRPTDLDRPARANRGVVFVGSAWFSGSTLLGVALGAHASIFYAGEAAKTRSFGDATEPLKRRVCRTCGPGCPIWDDLTVRVNDGPLLMLRRERDGRVVDGVITPDDETRDWYAGHPPAIVLDLRWRDELEAAELAVFDEIAGEANTAYAWEDRR